MLQNSQFLKNAFSALFFASTAALASQALADSNYLLCPSEKNFPPGNYTVQPSRIGTSVCPDGSSLGDIFAFNPTLATNNTTDHSMWVTIYGPFGEIQDADCVPSKKGRSWHGKLYGTTYEIRAEVYEGNCSGYRFFDTSYHITPSGGGVSAAPTDVVANLKYSGSGYYWESGNEANAPALDKRRFIIHPRGNTSLALSINLNSIDCFLGVGQDCKLVLAANAPGQLAQVWEREYWGGAGVRLKNVRTGLYAYVSTGNQQVSLLEPEFNDFHNDQYLGGSAWTIGGDCSSNCALRPLRDSSQNLNAFGDSMSIGNPVGTWSWGGGAGNETWLFEYVN